MNVPLLDLQAQYKPIKEEIAIALQEVLDTNGFAGGPIVEKFETLFAPFCQVDHAVGVNSGTGALWIALLALGVGSGDEIITTSNTFIATAEAISFSGATPVFVDIDRDTFNIDPKLIESAITVKTKAIIPVHLYGRMADMDPIMEIAEAHNLAVIEDACQAHGAEYNGRRAGSIGDAGCFSFYPGKNLGAYGEAGAITTNNEKLAATIKMFRDHGQNTKYYHSIIGWNGRMDGFQGAVLSVKMKNMEEWTVARIKNAALYDDLLKNVEGVETPSRVENGRHVYHIYAIRVAERDKVLHDMAAQGIYCGIHYPIPVHLQEAYKQLACSRGDFPATEAAADTVLSLPMFPELTIEQILFTTDTLNNILRKQKNG